jgi:RNA polymerase sigma factor (sigma-70 family)
MGLTDSGITGGREFPSTSWSVIVRARDPSSPDYAQHLGRLIELYWKPVYCVIRQGSRRSDADAKDLTQEFFAMVVLDRDLLMTFAPERGSFRALLRTALARFLHDEHRTAARLKRGGGAVPVSLEAVGAAVVEAVPGADALTPEQIFDLVWNEAVMSEALAMLERRLAGAGKQAAFRVFRRYDIEGDGAELNYAQLGAELSLSAWQVKHALREARTAFREIVTGLVCEYVDDRADMAAELRSLFGV